MYSEAVSKGSYGFQLEMALYRDDIRSPKNRIDHGGQEKSGLESVSEQSHYIWPSQPIDLIRFTFESSDEFVVVAVREVDLPMIRPINGMFPIGCSDGLTEPFEGNSSHVSSEEIEFPSQLRFDQVPGWPGASRRYR